MAQAETPYKQIPVGEAARIAETFEKSMVVINAWDPTHELLHTTTYGVDPTDKIMAAEIGELCAVLLGADAMREVTYSDFRLMGAGNAIKVIDTLVRACRAADHLLASLIYIRNGASDELLIDVRAAVTHALKVAAKG